MGKCPMLFSGRIVRLTCACHVVNQMLPVRRGEGCLVIYDLVASFKIEKKKVNMGDVWFRVSPLSLSHSLCLSVSLRARF